MPGAAKIPRKVSRGNTFLWPDDNRRVPKEIRQAARKKREKRGKLGGTRALLEAVYGRRTDIKRTPRASDIRKLNDMD